MLIRVQLAISDLLLSPTTSVRALPFPLDLLTLPKRVPQELSRGKGGGPLHVDIYYIVQLNNIPFYFIF